MASSANEVLNISEGGVTTSLGYDEIGNLISDGSKVLTWTIDGLLESVTTGDVNINFSYDALNRRIEKKVYINNILNQTTEFIYDGWQVLEERTGSSLKSFVYGDYIDEVVYVENNGVGYYPLRGVNFNVEALTNSSGDLVESYAIDAFGNFKVFDADGVEKATSAKLNSILFQGREYDDDVGLYYFRNRWYSSEVGAFVSRDPLRYEAGDINLHRLVGNDPLNGLDPMGLMKVEFQNTCACTSNQKQIIEKAVKAAGKMVDRAQKLLGGNDKILFAQWFDRRINSKSVTDLAQAKANYSKVKENFVKIHSAFLSGTLILDCQIGTGYAYVHTNDGVNKIYFENLFWTAPLTGRNSKGGTIVHEISHETVNTSDYGYGIKNALGFAQNNPTKAIDNADNYEFYAEDAK